MKYPIYITKEQIELLKYEILSQDFYIRITRELLEVCEEHNGLITSKKNMFINLARTIAGGKIYVLKSDNDGYYHNAEHDWHNGNFLIVIRNLNTFEFIEFACELLKKAYFNLEHLNDLLTMENASFRFIEHPKYGVDVFSISELELEKKDKSHPNIRLLVERMDNAYSSKDYSGVLHASSNILETMAKDIIGIESIEDQTLKSFFDRYRKDSSFPKEILDYILLIYENRNTEPLAGHGSTLLSSIDKNKATYLRELTKAFIKIEYQLKWE